MFVMVARWGTVRLAVPGPPYSKMRPTPPLTLSRRKSSRMMSLADTQGGISPVSTTVWGCVGMPCHRHGDIQPPRPSPACRAHHRSVCDVTASVFPGRRIAQMDLMADAIAAAKTILVPRPFVVIVRIAAVCSMLHRQLMSQCARGRADASNW